MRNGLYTFCTICYCLIWFYKDGIFHSQATPQIREHILAMNQLLISMHMSIILALY